MGTQSAYTFRTLLRIMTSDCTWGRRGRRGGARTPACRVETVLDARSARMTRTLVSKSRAGVEMSLDTWTFYISRVRSEVGGAGGFACQPALDHSQSAAEVTRPSVTGFSSI